MASPLRHSALDRLPLHDVRIVSIEQFGAGPFATQLLADQGADVIKVEDPTSGGDVGRYIPPTSVEGTSLYFEAFNRGKRSIALDLKTPAGRRVFSELISNADVLFANLRGDQAARLRLRYSDLADTNRRLVCAMLTGYGRFGERASLPAYDALIQAETGWAALTGEPDGPPTKTGLSLADYVGGLSAALAIMVAVHSARRSGVGCDVDVSLYDAAISMLTYPATWFLSAGYETTRHEMSGHPSIVPFQFFRTHDGYIAIACAKEKFFRTLVTLIDDARLDVPEFRDFAERRDHRNELVRLLTDIFASRSTSAWIALLGGKVPVAPVVTMADALDRGMLAARDMLIEYDHPALGRVTSVRGPFRLSGAQVAPRRGPMHDEHRLEVLRELGMTESEIHKLSREGAFGTAGRVDVGDGP